MNTQREVPQSEAKLTAPRNTDTLQVSLILCFVESREYVSRTYVAMVKGQF